MTPDERAAQAVPRDVAALSRDELIVGVAEAIREAVAAERRACARVAAVMGMPRENGKPRRNTPTEQTARLAVRIAQAIEARGSG